MSVRTGVKATCIAATLSCCLCARPPRVQWIRTFGPSLDTVVTCVQPTEDKGFIAAVTVHGSVFSRNTCLLKLDAAGRTKWLRNWDRESVHLQAYAVQQTTDGGYVAAGFGDDTTRVMILKTDSLGDQQWRCDVPPWAFAFDIRQTGDRGYITGGLWVLKDSLYFMKLDSLGRLQWRITSLWSPVPGYCGQPEEEVWGWRASVRQTRDGGYILARFVLQKADAAGSLLWTRDYDPAMFAIHDMEQTSDGGYIATGVGPFGGVLGSFAREQVLGHHHGQHLRHVLYWVVLKTDSLGIPKWKKVFAPPLTSLINGGNVLTNGVCVIQTTDGGYVLGGSLQTTAFKWIGRLVKIDHRGNPIWTMTFRDWHAVNFCQQTADGGYIIGDGDKHIMKLAPEGK